MPDFSLKEIAAFVRSHQLEAIIHPRGFVIATSILHCKNPGRVEGFTVMEADAEYFVEETANLHTMTEARAWLGY